MSEQEYAKIVAKNLKRIAYDSGKTQADISRDLKINKQTVSSWFRGERIPRMSKIDMLCNYFNVRRSDIMEESAEGFRRFANSFNEKFHIKILLSEEEFDLIKKFRTLDSHGKDIASTILSKEYDRCKPADESWLPEEEVYKLNREEFENTINGNDYSMAARNGKNKDEANE